jgi:hypothetical protein
MNIVKDGFREASHIVNQMTISWDEASLLNHWNAAVAAVSDTAPLPTSIKD